MTGFDRQEADRRLSYDEREADEARLAAQDQAAEMAPAVSERPVSLSAGRSLTAEDEDPPQRCSSCGGRGGWGSINACLDCQGRGWS